MIKRDFKGIWIPAEIWCDRNLSWTEKIMLREIDSLQDENEGGCYASNGYFSEFFGLSKSRVSEIISSLECKKYTRSLLVKYTERGQIRTRRIIKTTKKSLRKTETPPSEKRKDYSTKQTGYSEKAQYNNTENNKSKDSGASPGVSPERRAKTRAWLRTLGIEKEFPKAGTGKEGSSGEKSDSQIN